MRSPSSTHPAVSPKRIVQQHLNFLVLRRAGSARMWQQKLLGHTLELRVDQLLHLAQHLGHAPHLKQRARCDHQPRRTTPRAICHGSAEKQA
eukprot:1922409-Prymnesium_polylepis.1